MTRKTRRRTLLALLATASAAALAFAAMTLWQLVGEKPAATPLPGQGVAHAKGNKQLYTCGMHPNVVQEGPGKCPICGMDLTPMKSGTAGGGSKGAKTVTIDPVVVQNMGVRVAKITRRDLTRAIRTIGEVVVAEDRLSVVNLKFSGWIERLYVDKTGTHVRRGQPLFRIYSPELVAAQEEYLLAVKASGEKSPLARAARTKLRLFDLPSYLLRAIVKRGKSLRTLTIRAPRSGYVLQKNVVQGARVIAGQDLFRIGKLSAIWVHVQVYEFQAPWVKLGQTATMELSFQRGKLYKGKVSYIYPTLNKRTRTLTVRLEFVNPELRLKPGMFTTVRIKTRKREDVLAIPTEAIIHSGERQLVFVARGHGKFEARQIITGLTADGFLTEVKSGVAAGETVVVSGQFLLDSESQLREAVQKLLAARLLMKNKAAKRSGSRATSMPASTHKRGASGKGKGAIYTCPMHPTIKRGKPGKCPICGMHLVKKGAKSKGAK